MQYIASLLGLVVSAGLASWLTGPLRAEQPAPYEVDTQTLHLYHFDEDRGGFADAATMDKAFALSRKGGAGVMRSYQGFGNALDTHSKRDARAITTTKQSSETFWNSDSRAFTYEALLRIDFDPHEVIEDRDTRMMICSVDSVLAAKTRSLEFCLRPAGIYGATTPSLEFLRMAAEGDGSRIFPIVAPLPRSGQHSPQRGMWYHVAVTYNGEVNTPDNVKFYWTSLASGATQANLIHKATLTHEMRSQQKVLDLAVGNSARKDDGYAENWGGQIDEVRISSVARAADEFLFSKSAVAAKP